MYIAQIFSWPLVIKEKADSVFLWFLLSCVYQRICGGEEFPLKLWSASTRTVARVHELGARDLVT